ncbi:MAG: hypothetical protein WC768_02410 [Patescibacteria group bacterium]|jgi:hypothetical protein
MKKNLILLLILFLAVTVSACGKTVKTEPETINVNGASETGTTIDLSDKNGQTVNAKIGDVLYLKLTGVAASGKQWLVVAPTQGDFLLLKDHKLVGLNDPKVLAGQFTDEWWLKIEKAAAFDLQFDYGIFGKKSEQSFKVTITSQ